MPHTFSVSLTSISVSCKCTVFRRFFLYLLLCNESRIASIFVYVMIQLSTTSNTLGMCFRRGHRNTFSHAFVIWCECVRRVICRSQFVCEISLIHSLSLSPSPKPRLSDCHDNAQRQRITCFKRKRTHFPTNVRTI